MQKNALGTKLGNFPSLPIPVGGGVLHGTRQSSPAVQSWGRSLPNIEAGAPVLRALAASAENKNRFVTRVRASNSLCTAENKRVKEVRDFSAQIP